MILVEKLSQDRVLLYPDNPNDHKLLYEEALGYADAMRASRGRRNDIPPMYCSALPDDAMQAKDRGEFKPAQILVISIGGTNTHFRALQIQQGKVWVRYDLNNNLQRKIPTPCSDGKKYTLQEMLAPIAQQARAWLRRFEQKDDNFEILISWSFPQTAYRLDPKRGITGAYGQSMTKGQSGVQAEGLAIQEVLRECLLSIVRDDPELVSRYRQMKISVQNDAVMAAHRYLTRTRRSRYKKIGLMILGTGCNLTTSEPHLVGSNGELILDEQGIAKRLQEKEHPKKSKYNNFWVNYEIGHLVPVLTRAKIDRIPAPDKEKYDENIENFGLGGTGFVRIFTNLVTDYLADNQDLLQKISQTYPNDRLDAKWIASLAGEKDSKDTLEILVRLGEAGVSKKAQQELQYLAGVVVHRCCLRAAQVLAGMSLFNGFGLHTDLKSDALAMEGSIWKIDHFQDKLLKFWSLILSNELQELSLKRMNVELIVEDDYNAGILGPAYMLGQFSL